MKNSSRSENTQSAADAKSQSGKRFVSPRQLSERWNCSPWTAQRIARGAGISRYCLGEGRNGTVRYLLSEVEAYEERRRVIARP